MSNEGTSGSGFEVDGADEAVAVVPDVPRVSRPTFVLVFVRPICTGKKRSKAEIEI